MCGVGLIGFVIAHHFSVTMIRRDQDFSPDFLHGIHYPPNTNIQVFDCLDGGLKITAVAHHIGIGVIADNHVIVTTLDCRHQFVSDFRGAHFRLLVIGRDIGGIDQNAIFKFKRLFPPAIEEECDMGVFFCLGETQLAQTKSGDILTKYILETVWRVSHWNIIVRFIFCQTDKPPQFWRCLARERIEVWFDEWSGDLSCPVRAVIHENHHITVLDLHRLGACRYNRCGFDEFVKATAIVPAGTQPVKVEDGDVVIFMNYRSDRARQITRPFIEPDFDAFPRQATPKLGRFVSLTEYKSDYDIPVAYPPDRLKNVFGEYISRLGLRQLRLAETEKYAHVTFFFNGGREEPFEFEDRILVNSPNVSTYNQQPEMSAPEVTDKLVAAIESSNYDVIICNYANPDMVGHSGNFEATVKAIEYLDICIGRVVDAVQKVGGEILITADHGNAEMMRNDETDQPHTAHTTNPVPLLYVGRSLKLNPSGGALSDVIPTMLDLMGLEQPAEMTGHSLIEHADDDALTTKAHQA